MIEKAKKIEQNNADAYIYIIKCKREFEQPKYTNIYLTPKDYLEENITENKKEVLSKLFKKIQKHNLNIDSSAYNKEYNNCFKFESIVSNNKLLDVKENYPVHGIIKWNQLYIPTWVVISFFIRGNIYYVGETSDKITNRIKNHKKGKTNFFKIHKPINIIEVWEINYHKFNGDNYKKGIFNDIKMRRNYRVEQFVTSSLNKESSIGQRERFVYSN